MSRHVSGLGRVAQDVGEERVHLFEGEVARRGKHELLRVLERLVDDRGRGRSLRRRGLHALCGVADTLMVVDAWRDEHLDAVRGFLARALLLVQEHAQHDVRQVAQLDAMKVRVRLLGEDRWGSRHRARAPAQHIEERVDVRLGGEVEARAHVPMA